MEQRRARVVFGSAAARLEASQNRRRQEALRRQKEARRHLTQQARRQAAEPELDAAMEDVQAPASNCRPQRRRAHVRARAKQWWGEVCTPEWLVDVPEGLDGRGHALGLGWYCVARPEGTRCVVVASGGTTTSRTTSGEVVEVFESRLPGGEARTVVDCVRTDRGDYWCMDVMCWADYSLYECTAEFRFYWLRTKLAEIGERDMRPAICWECDPESLEKAYTAPLPYLRDGLLFYAKQGHYALGLTPLVCLWKDERTTRYWRGFSACVLEIDAGGQPTTLDGVAVSETSDSLEPRLALEPGDLARFDLVPHPDLGFQARFAAACSPKRPAPDSSTKLAFALRLHQGRPLSFEEIRQAALLKPAPAV